MPTIKASDVIGQSMYAGARPVPVYAADLKTVKYTVKPGEYIGTVYSWIEPAGGGLYWLFYRTSTDYNNQAGSYIRNNSADLSLPALPDILKAIEDKKKAEADANKSTLQKFIDDYAPWLIGGVVVAVALPSVMRSIRKPAVSGTDSKQLLLWLGLIVAAGYIYRKKYKGSIIIDPLDKGEFLPDVVDNIYIDGTQFPAGFPQMGLIGRSPVLLMP